MDDRYETQGFSDDQLLDELMCEYVDGTMDPSIRKVFDELVKANPVVARSCNCAREVQSILKNAGHHVCAPHQFQSRLRARLNAETGKIDVSGIVPAAAVSANDSPIRYLALITIFVCSGLVLSRHDNQNETIARATPFEVVDAPVNQTPKMTPARGDVTLTFAVPSSASETIQIQRTNRGVNVPADDAQLSTALLAD